MYTREWNKTHIFEYLKAFQGAFYKKNLEAMLPPAPEETQNYIRS